MKTLLSLLTGAVLAGSFAFAATETMTTARIAELTAHRLDRLVSLNKIDAAFLKRTEKIEVTAVQNQAPVAFKSLVSQTAPATGSPIQVELSFDASGKPVSFKLISGGVAGPDSGWTGQNSVSLAESSLHYLEANPTDPKLAPFYEGLSSLVLTKGTLKGQTVAQVTVKSTKIAQTLNVYIKLDGTVISSEVVP